MRLTDGFGGSLPNMHLAGLCFGVRQRQPSSLSCAAAKARRSLRA